MKVLVNKSKRGEKGQALILVLILMAVGGLIIAPLLSYMSSGVKVEEKYEYLADEFYAADAGVADGLWQIKYNHLESLWSNYEEYDYTTEYDYDDSYPVYPVKVNGIDVDVTIENIWIPKDIAEPSLNEANRVAGTAKLMITDNVSAQSTQQIKIYYYKETSDPDLYVTKLGIWLPPGFSYDVTGVCTLETWLNANHKNYSRQITPYCGGEAVVWTLDTVKFTDLPGTSILDNPITSIITFKFTTTQPGRSLEALSWITTSGVSDIPYTWDADVKVYHITSQAGDENGTIVDAYAIKSELRKMGGAISGDYRAIGATLMIEGTGHPSNPYDIRYQLLDSNTATASDIPATAQVDAAYLYWSAWVEEAPEETLFLDTCANINNGNWTYGSDWHQSGSYTAFYAGDQSHGGRELAMAHTVNLMSYGSGKVTVSWRNWLYLRNLESGDCFQYAFYRASDGWGSWNTAFCDDTQVGTSSSPVTFSFTVPDNYLTSEFKMKFQILSFDGTYEYCYIDNIEITAQLEIEADTSVVFKINTNQVYFADDEYGNPTVPTIGSEELPADRWQLLQNFTGEGEPNGYSYAGYKDVTGLLQAFSSQGAGTNRTGNGTYTLGSVTGDTGDQWSYAAWSLIIIYSSPETQGHQLYLYDDDLIYSGMNCNVDFDGDGQAGGTISGFLVPDPIAGEVNAAQITCFVGEGDECFGDHPPNDIDCLILNGHKLSNSVSPQNNVWNSKSPDLVQDGIDIDTFNITWASDILEADDSSAQVDLQTGTDSWNLVYIILSFRSSTVTGGTITYLLRG
jgi:hypothetical protein